MPEPLFITDRSLYNEWESKLQNHRPSLLPSDHWRQLQKFKPAPLPERDQVASVASVAIEGNTVDLNFFIRSKMGQLKPSSKKKKEIDEIDDLIQAYHFARNHELTEKNVLKAHNIATKHLLSADRGQYRSSTMFVVSDYGIEYAAPEPEKLQERLTVFWGNVQDLLTEKTINPSLMINRSFYHAAFIHLVLEHLHPFSDGNGRIGRLIEKWFLASTLGSDAWNMASERYYADHRQAYYNALRLGVNFYELDYRRSIDFLLLLPKSLANTIKQANNNDE